VVNNAGVGSSGLVGELPIEDWQWTLQVDLFGVIHCCHVFVPLLKKQGSGQVLNVASAAGLLCVARMGAYNVAKAGVIALSETLHSELAGTGVGVTVLCPTFFRTNIIASGRYTDEATRRIAEGIMAKAPSGEAVVRAALLAVERNELYCVPMTDGRWLWRLKRAAPVFFGKLLGLHTQYDRRRRARNQARTAP
jgi:short-subunit dehydrogenase